MALVVSTAGVDGVLSGLAAAGQPGVVIGEVASGSGVRFA
jgi:hypothetical protein